MSRKLCSLQSIVGRILCFSALVGAASFFTLSNDARGQLFTAPPGGWAYTYDGSTVANTIDAALDGTWNYDNGSDAWDGTGPGTGIVGGAGVFTDTGSTYLRVQDTGDPRDYGVASGTGDEDPSNRKVYFTHDLAADGATSSVLNDGVTLSFRARVSTIGTLDDAHPDGGGGIVPWPAGGDGTVITDSGKGMVGIRQGNGGMISFSMALPTDTTETGPNGGLVMNQLNGSSISGDIDTGDGGTPNFQALDDPTAFHEFWVVIKGVQGEGTHSVRIWMDGDEDNQSVFAVTAGNTTEGPFDTLLALGASSTGRIGAFDLDFVSVKPGLFFPSGPLVPGDTNGDGDVTIEDFEPIRANFLQNVLTREEGDLTLDGLVNFDDFDEFKVEFLAGGGSLGDINWGSVPEPSAAVLLIVAMVFCALRRCSRRS